MSVDPQQLMQLAIDRAREGIAAGQSPFGCAIYVEGQIVSVAHNAVWATTDITAHAEVNAIRQACQKRNTVFLTDATVATTCEPCPMCMTALHWARVGTVYFGASVADAAQAGFREVRLAAEEVVRAAGNSIRLEPHFMAEACRALFDEWLHHPEHREY